MAFSVVCVVFGRSPREIRRVIVGFVTVQVSYFVVNARPWSDVLIGYELVNRVVLAASCVLDSCNE